MIPAQKPAYPGTITVHNSRTPIPNKLTVQEQTAYAPLIKFSAERTAYINRGLENRGISGTLSSATGFTLYSPERFDRCAVLTDDGGKHTLIAKGSGLRTWQHAYLAEEGITQPLSQSESHKPIDLNPNPEDTCHPLIGGGTFSGLMKDVNGSLTMQFLAGALGTEEKPHGLITPLAIRCLKTFPIILGERVKLVRGWDFFTNLKYMSRQQLLNMANSLEAPSGLTGQALRSFKKYTGANKKAPLVVRWLVGRAFMKIKKPAVYEYLCAKGEFRIGHLYDQLVTGRSNALMDKASMDKKVVALYELFGQKVELPAATDHDLSSEEGRAAYLRQIFTYQDNAKAGTALACAIATEIGQQLGILHGAGGHAGGHVYIHHLGKIEMVLENQAERKRIKITLDQNKPAKAYDHLDLTGYRVVSMTAGESGQHTFGTVGGGSTRPDNIGYGLRDLGTIRSSVDPDLKKIIYRYPQMIGGLDINTLLEYFHVKLVQQADKDMLFAVRFRQEVAAAGGFTGDTEGAFPQLVRALGGDQTTFQAVQAAFTEGYDKYYTLSREKHALIFYQGLDGAKTTPRLIFHSPSEDNSGARFIEEFLAGREQIDRAA
jgi:hypothetical protein